MASRCVHVHASWCSPSVRVCWDHDHVQQPCSGGKAGIACPARCFVVLRFANLPILVVFFLPCNCAAFIHGLPARRWFHGTDYWSSVLWAAVVAVGVKPCVRCILVVHQHRRNPAVWHRDVVVSESIRPTNASSCCRRLGSELNATWVSPTWMGPQRFRFLTVLLCLRGEEVATKQRTRPLHPPSCPRDAKRPAPLPSQASDALVVLTREAGVPIKASACLLLRTRFSPSEGRGRFSGHLRPHLHKVHHHTPRTTLSPK